MKLLHRRAYQKQEPWRDATLIFVVCEGKQREPGYFAFFEELDSRLKLVIIPSDNGKSAPNHLLENAQNALGKYNPEKGSYTLYFVMDTDQWGEKHLHQVWADCLKKEEWNMVLSNPCFEVWLYFHKKKKLPGNIYETCKDWKKLVNQIFEGGFDSARHPALIKTAIENAKNNYTENGFEPKPGSTQLFKLGQKIYELTRNKLRETHNI